MSYTIAALPGDGIGPEVLDVALRVLNAAIKRLPDLQLDVTCYAAGAKHYRETGVTLPGDVVQACLDADAVLLSAIGLPDVRRPDGTEVQPEMMVGLRRAMNLHSAVRPVRLYDGVSSPLKDTAAGIDFVILRENLEGLFASYGGGTLTGGTVATDTLVITRAGTTKVVDYAFRLAQRRNGRLKDGKKLVTCVDKANIFRSYAFFREVFYDVARQYPDIETEAVYVDAMSMYMVQDPTAYDVLVMENQFGDILSDLGAGLVGGLGLAPTAEVGDERGLFQPTHGSAPQLAGKNIANPMAMILSVAMMLDWLGERNNDTDATACGRLIESASECVLRNRVVRTPDLGGSSSTTDVGQAVIEQLG
ncbi:MAG: isocitrate/isopropylmalate dehydrogenase family protein [Planctomycetota bacterium]|nr:isocitrate/isopropylmalate dehydrogenase family protein [Planctomycetota bacterium]MDA1162578.1 isocitrate/isopropylmalate dehydrogenase family protein [Planctomycetota bacterium]